jgi:hypothetical protein
MVDLTEYNDLLQKARALTFETHKPIAKDYVPKLFAALISQGYKLPQSRKKVVRDCKAELGWKEQTIIDELPDEAKDAAKQKNGRASAKAKEEMA